MSRLEHLIRTNGGLIATHELMSAGFGRATIRRLVAEQRLWRIRQGWYAAPGTHVELTHAARVGGVVTCSSALRRAGLWAIDLADLHVRVAPNACQLRAPRDRSTRLSPDASAGVVVHWRHEEPWAPRPIDSSHDVDLSVRRLLAPTSAALHDYRSCVGTELYLAALDSQLHQQPMTRALLRSSGHPVGIAGIDGVCESGLETIVWLRLRLQLPLRRQVQVAGVGRVDFMIGDRLVVEIDGREHHSSREQFEVDRRRDAALSARGYRSLRFSYRQVMDHWARVEQAILGACARGHHLA